ncbi:protein of unknown function [Halomicrobium zhouii]|uniref:Protein-glutamine gamma-glutamyltransferase-like C-terminal domain-containing protein n=1 Tax=Halomicrobium zhouii TaxID=767519 RepID=A0A1I6KG96_9EURY|nr:DUF4129 domain-containing protein [Halomicrobium zhouii]SFR90275.1 protein of unknown function [Halomicrobium zhouii]
MKRETGAWLAVALLSISAMGVSATTLESTMSTDANDVIDLDYDQVPIGQDTASNVMDEIEGDEREGEPASAMSSNPGDQRESTSSQPAESQSQQRQQQQQREQQQREQQQDESGEQGLEPMSLLDRLLALLMALLPYLLVLAAVLGAGGLAYRYRERLLAAFADPDDEEDAEGPAPAAEADPREGSPAHAVERAWLGMVRHLDLDRPGTMTTSECASAAIEAGLDREAVKRLTETYEEVRYGGRPVTAQREETARQSRDRLDAGGGT